MKRKLWIMLALAVILTVLCCGAALADESGSCGDNLQWTLADAGALTITGTGPMTEFSSANPSPFKGNTAITSISIGEGVTSIGYDAFNGCTGVTSVAFPSTLQRIGAWSFYKCKMSSVAFPAGLTYIGGAAFEDCTNLQNVVIQDGVTEISSSVFMGCTKLESVTIPSSVTSIGNYAFYSCNRLNNVTIPAQVTSIGGQAFAGCRTFTVINVPAAVTSIGKEAFRACSNMTHITINNPDTAFGTDVFITGNANLTIHALYDSTAEAYATANTIGFANLSFTVIFTANGGTGSMSPVTVTHARYTLPECEFTEPTHATFTGWNLGQPGETVTIAENTVITAQWANDIQISFEANGGSGIMNSEYLRYDITAYTLPECTFTAPTHYSFSSWNLGQPGDRISISGNITLTAQWKENPKVTFYANGGSGTMNMVYLAADATAYTLPNCTFTAPTHFSFDGWDLGQPGDEISVSGNITLTAQWKEDPKVTFYANGGTGTMETVHLAKGTTVYKLPSCSFTPPAGKMFDKWNLGTVGTSVLIDDVLNLVAQWKDAYIITFDPGEGSGTMDSVLIDPDSNLYTLPPNGFTAPENKVFKAWLVEGDERPFSPGQLWPVHGNITITALWHYGLWVGGVEVSDENKDYIDCANNGYASFDPAAFTLTMHDVSDMTGAYVYDSSDETYKSFIYYRADRPLTVTGTVTIDGGMSMYPIYVKNLVTNTGTHITVKHNGYGLVCTRLTMNGGLYYIANVWNDGIDADYITINGGQIYTQGEADGIRCDEELSINGGYLEAIGDVIGINLTNNVYGAPGSPSWAAMTVKGANTVIEASSRSNSYAFRGREIIFEPGLGFTEGGIEDSKITISAVPVHTITFAGNGAIGSMGSVYLPATTSSYILPECGFITPEDKVFAGWDLGPVGTEISVTGDITLTAQWTDKPRTITFSAGSGTGAMEPVIIANGSEYTLPDNGFTPPEAAEFWRWETAQGTLKPGDIITVTEDITITARYRSAYTVTIERDYGDFTAMGSQGNITVYAGQKLTLPKCMLSVPDGTIFDYWELSGGYGTGVPGDEIEIHDDVTLYIRWIEYYQVSFNTGGICSMPDPQIVKEGHTVDLPQVVSATYTFLGWHVDEECRYEFDPNTPVMENFILYAKWMPKPVITYYNNYPNAPDSTGLDRIEYGATAEERVGADPYLPSLYEPYVFDGWFADADLTVPFDFTAPIYVDTNIYGRWRLPSYTATFDSHGGTPVPSQTYTAGSLLTEPEAPTKVGYYFDGWYFMNGDSEYRWQFLTDTLNHDVTIFARWVEPDLSACLRLPAGLTEIEEEAFYGNRSYTAVIVPRSVTAIGDYSLGCYNSGNIEHVYNGNLFILGYAGSAVETYAKVHNMIFIPIDDAWLASH